MSTTNLITIAVLRAFVLTLDDHTKRAFAQGPHEVTPEIASHWYVQAHSEVVPVEPAVDAVKAAAEADAQAALEAAEAEALALARVEAEALAKAEAESLAKAEGEPKKPAKK